MRIFFDTTATQLGRAGTVVYVQELLTALQRADSKHEIVEFSCRVPYAGKNRLLKKAQTAYRDIFWQNAVVPRYLKKHGADLMHSPVLRTTLRKDIPLAITALDFYALRDPKAFSRWSAVYGKQLSKILNNAKVILSISEFTKDELIHFYPEIPEEKIFVTPLGVSSDFRVASEEEKKRVRAKYNLDRPYMLCVNTLEPRKNLPAFIKAFNKTADKIAEDILMIGGSGWIPGHENSLLDSMNSNARIHYPGYVPDEDLAPLYSMASFYVFPSLYEGFGLPVLEAMACGCPVLTSRGSSLSEVAGDAALFMNPDSIDDIARGLRECNSMSAKQRESLIKRGFERVTEFSWDICAERTLKAYEYAENV